MQEEIWKDVVGFEQYFRVSNLGRVFSKRTNKILVQTKLKCGYMAINTRIGGRRGTCHSLRVHRMVADAFLEAPTEDQQKFAAKSAYGKVWVNHKDGNKLNNQLCNLEWVTASENAKHARAMGLQKSLRGENCPHSKLTEVDVIKILEMYEPGVYGKGRISIAKSLNLPAAAVSSVIHSGNWGHLQSQER